MQFQNTIQKRIDFDGIGIHSGERVRASLLPAPVNTGIVFLPAGKNGGEGILAEGGIQAHVKNLLLTSNAITIGHEMFSVQTIEHFMAAFYAMDVDNLFVLVEGSELPILDGSSKDIVKAIDETGTFAQSALQEAFSIPYPIWIENGGSYLIALPGDDFKITYTIDFSSKSHAVGTQTAHYRIDKETFAKALAPARTFGFYEEIEYMKGKRLARGGSLENALIFTKDGLMNEELRFTDECVRHKILDLIGDLSLVGCKLSGHFIAHKSGHTMDMELVKRINRVIKRTGVAFRISRNILRKKHQEYARFKKRLKLA